MPAPLQVFEHTTQIREDDIKGGHVHNSRFFTYIGNACDEWYRALSFAADTISPGAPAVAHVSNDFLRQMTFPGEVMCKLTAVRVGRTSLEHAVELRDANNPDVICGRGKIVHVWMDLTIGKSAPWPREVLAKCWSDSAQ